MYNNHRPPPKRNEINFQSFEKIKLLRESQLQVWILEKINEFCGFTRTFFASKLNLASVHGKFSDISRIQSFEVSSAMSVLKLFSLIRKRNSTTNKDGKIYDLNRKQLNKKKKATIYMEITNSVKNKIFRESWIVFVNKSSQIIIFLSY